MLSVAADGYAEARVKGGPRGWGRSDSGSNKKQRKEV